MWLNKALRCGEARRLQWCSFTCLHPDDDNLTPAGCVAPPRQPRLRLPTCKSPFANGCVIRGPSKKQKTFPPRDQTCHAPTRSYPQRKLYLFVTDGMRWPPLGQNRTPEKEHHDQCNTRCNQSTRRLETQSGECRNHISEASPWLRCCLWNATSQIAFSTGAEIQFADREEVERILLATQHDGYPLRSLIHHIVASPMFRNR